MDDLHKSWLFEDIAFEIEQREFVKDLLKKDPGHLVFVEILKAINKRLGELRKETT